MLALQAQELTFRYAQHVALRELSLSVNQGEIFALLGPNGSGKTTLFRLISTLARVQQGDVRVFGHSVRDNRGQVRALLGVVFQSPSLDPKLTVLENIRCQAALYGIAGSQLQERIASVTSQLGLQDRLATKAEELSGGLKRRVELAKGILHQPRLLLMDEPSTGLDPASRLDMWHAIKDLQARSGVTVLLTTHLLEEAEKADRIGIMDEGSMVALGPPQELRQQLGEQVLSVQTLRQDAVVSWLQERVSEPHVADERIRVVGSDAAQLIQPLLSEFGDQIQSVTLGQPSLEDVFVERTGHKFWDEPRG